LENDGGSTATNNTVIEFNAVFIVNEVIFYLISEKHGNNEGEKRSSDTSKNYCCFEKLEKSQYVQYLTICITLKHVHLDI